MKTKSNGEPASLLEQFELENARIHRDAEAAERDARAKVAEQEKKIAELKDRREQAAAEFERLRDDFERIEAQVLEEERRRIAAAAVKAEDVKSGLVSADKYFAEGQSSAAIDAAAREKTKHRLSELLAVVRAKSLEVLELEAEETEAERMLGALNTYPVAFMAERMRTQLKSLETLLMSNSGGMMPVWTKAEELKQTLKRAQGKAVTGMLWELDLAGVRRLRFDAGLPTSELEKLQEIITEMEANGAPAVQLRYVTLSPTGEKGLSVSVWRTKNARR